MIPNSRISVQRRISEAISAKMEYDFLCFRGSIMGEAYLGHSISEVLASFFDQATYRARNNYSHPALSSKKKGRKPEIDYIVEKLTPSRIVLALEAKWAGSSHCTADNILWDLVRLKALKDLMKGECLTCFLLAGKRDDLEKPFKAELFKQGTQSPLIFSSRREKNFRLENNLHHQAYIDKQIASWSKKYPALTIPSSFETRLEDDSRSANEKFRFSAKIWSVN